MKEYTGKGDSGGTAYKYLVLEQLERKTKRGNQVDDIDTGLFRGRDLAVDAGGSQPSWVVCLDELTVAYRMPPSEKMEADLLHLATSGARSIYIEAPFGSYRLPNRLKVVQAMEDNGVLFYPVDSHHSTRALYRLGISGPRTSKNLDGWTNPEAARAIAEYAISKQNVPGVLTPMTVARFTRDHKDRNTRRAEAQMILKDLRRGEDSYAGHTDRVLALAGKFRDPGLEKIALSSEVLLATLWVIGLYSPGQDDIDDFFPREGSYRVPHRDQAGLMRSNLTYHSKQWTLKDLRRAARAVRRIQIENKLGDGLAAS